MACCCLWDTIKVFWWMVWDPLSRLGRCLYPRSSKSIKGEVVLITGAGHGLGKEVAARLAELGPVLVLWDIDEASNESTASLLRARGHRVHSYAVDVTDERAVSAAAERVRREVGHVTLLLNNAGVFSGKPLCHLPGHVIRRCFEVNAIAHFWLLQQFLPHMLEQDRGHVVSVASIAGHQGVPNMTDYCASKHAAAGLMESLHMELQSQGKKGIRLTTLNPVIITTGLIANVKTRFPCLLPLLTVEETAAAVVSAILREEEEVFIPRRSRHLNDMVRCFSRRTRYKILDYVGYGFDPEDTNQPPSKKAAEIV